MDIVYLDNCGIDDEEMSSLLNGFCHLDRLRYLLYKENIFGPESLQAIQPLLLKRYPNNLRQLKLVKLNISQQLLCDLLHFMTEEPTSLISLSLVQMSIPSTTMPLIVEYIDSNGQLEELDLSWNKFVPPDFILLMNCLQNNVIIKNLNLSWNLMIPSRL